MSDMKWPEKKDLDAIIRMNGVGTESALACGFNEALDLIEPIRREVETREEYSGIKDGYCFVCGKNTNSWGANPSLWNIFMAHIDGQTKHRNYHMKCLYPILRKESHPPLDHGEFILKGKKVKESDFWVTIHLPNSGIILEVMKKDLAPNPELPSLTKDKQ